MKSITGMKNSVSVSQWVEYLLKTNCLPSDEEEDKGGCFCEELKVKRTKTIVMNENIVHLFHTQNIYDEAFRQSS